MCDGGISLQGAFWATTIIAAAAGSYTAYENKRMADKQLEYNADVANENRRMQLEQAGNIARQGEWERRNLAMNALQQEGQLRTQYGASGVALGAGSNANMMADIADAYNLDNAQLSFDIQTRGYQSKIQASNFASQASLYRLQRSQTSQQFINNSIGAGIQGMQLGTSVAGALKK